MAWSSQRVDFNTAEFQKVITQLGYQVTWSKASTCPCIPKDDQGQPDFNCVLCKGKGRFYHDPTAIQGIMTNFNQEAKYLNPGELMAGTSYFTTHGWNKLGFWDRITNYHSQIRYSEIVVKGDSGTIDQLRFTPESSIVLRTVGNEYINEVDYTVVGIGGVKWLPNGNEPKRGVQYTIEYMMHPSWIVIDLINVIRDTYVKKKKSGVSHEVLPVRAVVRLEFLT